jgi:hypothetical protein
MTAWHNMLKFTIHLLLRNTLSAMHQGAANYNELKLKTAIASLNKAFHLLPHENILTIAFTKIHYLYNN